MQDFRVEFKRQLTTKKVKNGLEFDKPSGLCYVDVFFPDGTQRTCGYIGVNAVAGSQFAPLVGIDQDLSNAIQQEINRQLACAESGPAGPVIIEYVGNEFEDEDDVDE